METKWSASISPEEMAVKLCDDLFKKFHKLESADPERVKIIVEGLIDGLKNVTFKHPMEGIPDYLKSMDTNYCAGHGVGSTWRRIANEWPKRG